MDTHSIRSEELITEHDQEARKKVKAIHKSKGPLSPELAETYGHDYFSTNII